MTRNFIPARKTVITGWQPSLWIGMTVAAKTRLSLLFLAGTLLAAFPVFAQSMPSWKSYTQTGNLRDVVPSAGNDNSVAAWFGKKVDVARINTASGTAGTDVNGAMNTFASSNFVPNISQNYMSVANQQLTTAKAVICPSFTGPNLPAVNCYSNINDGRMFANTNDRGPTTQTLNIANLPNAIVSSVGQFINGANHSKTQMVWGQNIVVNQDTDSGNTYGTETDINRSITGCSTATDMGQGGTNTCSYSIGQWVTGLNVGQTTGGYGYLVTMGGEGGANVPLFADGYAVVNNAIRDSGFMDASSSKAVLRAYNGHYYGIDFTEAVMINSAIMLPDTGYTGSAHPTSSGISWTSQKNTDGTATHTASISVGTADNAAIGSMVLDAGGFNFNPSRTTGTDMEIGSLTASSNSVLDFHTSGVNNDYDARLSFTGGSRTQPGQGNVELSSARFTVDGSLLAKGVFQLAVKTKAEILAITSPDEGMKVFDADDHVEVTYRCPTSTTCGWFPTQYGNPLSN